MRGDTQLTQEERYQIEVLLRDIPKVRLRSC
jgi:hypothetical protein